MLMAVVDGAAVRVGVLLTAGGVELAELVALGDAVRRGFGDCDVGSGSTEKLGATEGGGGDASPPLSPPGRLGGAAATATPRMSASTTATTTAIGEITGGADSSSSI